MLGLVVRFDLKDFEAARKFDSLVSEIISAVSEREPGTLIYSTATVKGAPLSRVFYELYASPEAFELHEQQPHTLRFLSEREHCIDNLRVEFLDETGGKGIPR